MIDPRRMRILRTLADHGTVTAAAEALYLSPSAVSQQLAALEREAGQPVTKQVGRNVVLTAAGQILLERATAVLTELERAEAELAACADGVKGRVSVAAFATAVPLMVAPAVRRLARTAPGVDLQVRDAEGHTSIPMLLQGEVDVAVSVDYPGSGGHDDRRTARVPLYTEPFDVLLPPDHRLATADACTTGELADEQWITPHPGNPCRDVVLAHCAAADVEPAVTHCTDDFRAAAALVGAGAGVALVPRLALAGTDPCGAVRSPLHGWAPQRRVFAAVRSGTPRHPLLSAVLDALVHSTPTV